MKLTVKRRLIAMVTIAVVWVIMAVAVPAGGRSSAADVEVIYTDNGHMLVEYPEVKADCTHAGNIKYYVCGDCGKLYTDDKATHEIKQGSEVIPALGHVWSVWTVVKEPTYTDYGVKTRVCLRNSNHMQSAGIEPLELPPEPQIAYKAYVQKEGWQSYVRNGQTAGSKGKSRRLEAIRVSLIDADGGIKYRVYDGTGGWQAYSADGTVAGTTGKSRRLEAFQAKLTGNVSKTHALYYRVYVQNFGWLGWARGGLIAGTGDFGYRIEAVQMKILKAGAKAPASAKQVFVRNRSKKKLYVVSSIKAPNLERRLTYNEKGLLIREEYVDCCIIDYSYNSSNLLSEASVSIGNGGNDGKETYRYFYDKLNNRTKVEFTSTTGRSFTFNYAYDKAGKLITFRECSYRYSGDRISEIRGNPTSPWDRVVYDAGGNISKIGSRSFDTGYENGRLVKNTGGEYTYKQIEVEAEYTELVKKQQWSLINEDVDALFAVIIGWG